MPAGPTILHADLDAFYASVEQLLDPALRGRPIAVGGSASGGAGLAASYKANAFAGVGGLSRPPSRPWGPRAPAPVFAWPARSGGWSGPSWAGRGGPGCWPSPTTTAPGGWWRRAGPGRGVGFRPSGGGSPPPSSCATCSATSP